MTGLAWAMSPRARSSVHRCTIRIEEMFPAAGRDSCALRCHVWRAGRLLSDAEGWIL